jgi:hypothetical protein
MFDYTRYQPDGLPRGSGFQKTDPEFSIVRLNTETKSQSRRSYRCFTRRYLGVTELTKLECVPIPTLTPGPISPAENVDFWVILLPTAAEIQVFLKKTLPPRLSSLVPFKPGYKQSSNHFKPTLIVCPEITLLI